MMAHLNAGCDDCQTVAVFFEKLAEITVVMRDQLAPDAVTRNALSIIFIALSPIMLVGSYLENRTGTKRALQTATAQFRSALTDLSGVATTRERPGRFGRWLTELFNEWPEGVRPD